MSPEEFDRCVFGLRMSGGHATATLISESRFVLDSYDRPLRPGEAAKDFMTCAKDIFLARNIESEKKVSK